jgi:hypothetical protein
MIPVRLDEIVVGDPELRSRRRALSDMHRHTEMGEHVQRAQPGLTSFLPDFIWSPPSPARALAVHVDELVVVVKDVIRDALERGP